MILNLRDLETHHLHWTSITLTVTVTDITYQISLSTSSCENTENMKTCIISSISKSLSKVC